MRKALGVAAVLAATALAPGLAQAEVGLHGFADLSWKNDYITPRGLRVTSEGSTIQFLNGLVLDFPQDPKGLVTDISLVGGTWSDFNPGYSKASNTQAFNEFDWFIGGNAKLGRDWTVGAQYVAFISAPGAYRTEKNIEFSLAFDDSRYLKTIQLHPYAKLFWATGGDSTVVTGRHGGTYDVEIGASPSLDLTPYGAPVTLSAPTWITVGPESFWGGGGNAGVFSTGLKATVPIKAPASAGHWSVYAGYQYYRLINDRLVLAESILNAGKRDKNLNLFQVGLGVGF